MPYKSAFTTKRIAEDATISEKLFHLSMYVWVMLLSLICVIPFWLVVIGSFTAEGSLRSQGFSLFPQEISLNSYRFLLSGEQVFVSYKNTIIITVVGTFLSVLITSMMAYVMANRKIKYRGVLSFIVYFTMLFGPGLVGFYILVVNWLHLKDTLWAIILPGLFGPWNAFLMVSYFRTIPYEINEAATIDGASESYIFFRIYMPISKPVIATVGLFVSLRYWNEWFYAMLFVDKEELHPLQIMIRSLMSNIDVQRYVQGTDVNIVTNVPAMGVQLATVCVTIGPILLVYPYVQKYFVKGLTIGSIKG
ncbi:carbohydrate ABC transporter permease [Paenibacillus montanisoli]|uniref:Carbohydrate ABC transporter permease n=1 Tax=Paenibacillus montanisoli TaxID=2081970 RepID=A0A328UB26_9BACL|nr:carbohydrate ABC transporter permease [Paenibacillus montanisoli]RAP78531.1 carbohydrate ABC transporter permease [Paenibacillus montanisoli]